MALVVLSIGLLGVAALQVEGLQTSRSALVRTRAVLLASDMVDRIRANPRAAASYTANWDPKGLPTPCADNPLGMIGADCTPDQMADYDVFVWKQALAPNGPNGLPGGEGSLQFDDTVAPPQHTVLVRWAEQGEQRTYTLVFQHDTSN